MNAHVRFRTGNMQLRHLGTNYTVKTTFAAIGQSSADRKTDAYQQDKDNAKGLSKKRMEYVKFFMHATV
jgi:hypothetical protein